MLVETKHIIELHEYQPQLVSGDILSMPTAQLLYDNYSNQVAVDRSTFSMVDEWNLTSQGWVGYIPLTPQIGISLQPKVCLENLFGMLEVAYDLQSFKWLHDLFDATSLADFYERLAIIFAQLTLQRFRQGIYRTYEAHTDELPYVRGRMDIDHMLKRPWQINLACAFEEHTADIEDNQIIAGAFQRILSSGNCTERSLPLVTAAYRNFYGIVTTTRRHAHICLNRFYNRLNADYRPLHALSYFFLADSGPSHQLGEQNMVPFLVNMATLYERFVAEWLRKHLDQRYTLRTQERHIIDADTGLHFNIDLVIRNTLTGQVHWVLDTKYKAPSGGPSTDDVAQIAAYAMSKGAREAVLIYPIHLTSPLDQWVGDVRVRTLAFGLDGNLDMAGQEFLHTLVSYA